MMVAITSTGESLADSVDLRFGRASYFIIIDTELMIFREIKNDNVAASGGAGVASAKLVIDSGAKAVVTGNCGPNAERTLRAAGVKLYTGAKGTVAEALELYRNGKLSEAGGPSVESHFGMER
jgi:predicted Fe-Mo cluster-binding NifX family protein